MAQAAPDVGATPSVRPRRIELFGPCGVGKSTVLAAALALLPGLRKRVASPLLLDDHLRAIRPRLADRRSLLDRPDIDPLARIALRIAGAARSTPGYRLLALEYFTATVQLHVAAETCALPLLVHDEMLLHRAFTLLALSDRPQQDARAWFSAVPLPDAGILCLAPAPLIAARFRSRDHGRLAYGDGDPARLQLQVQDMLACCTIAAEVLTKRGLRLHELDFSDQPGPTARILARVLQAEAAGPAPSEGG